MSDKVTGKTRNENTVAGAETPAASTEVWISTGFAEHTIVIPTSTSPKAVKFSGYRLELDLSNRADAEVSAGLHKCGREGRDLFVLKEAVPEHNVVGRAELLKVFRGFNPRQLRALVSCEQLAEAGIQPSTRDPDELIAVAIRHCSL